MPASVTAELKKIAFVAMPFRIRATGLAPDKGPARIDFDALWERAIFPALTELKYIPVRADVQTGAVIIKGMLQQLVHADLVLADISIANGNVYYEAGVRHTARPSGCILMSAEWANPLFDLEQITQLRYPLPVDNPSTIHYQAVIERLRSAIPLLCDSKGPVYELTRISDLSVSGSRHLQDSSSLLVAFQTRLRAAKLQAADGINAPLRAILDMQGLQDLPVYALMELVAVVRDNLNWSEFLALLNSFPQTVSNQPFFLEQRALATGKLGHVDDAIALLEQVVERHGETAERLGTIGGRYRQLARDEPNRQRKAASQSKAVECYQRGMQLDLNQYYCAFKLLIALVERAQSGDKDRAGKCSAHVLAACQRARAMNLADEWLNCALLVHAFYECDADLAREVVDEILDHGWANWKLVGLCEDLKSLLAAMDEEPEPAFQEIFDDLHQSLPVSQQTLLELVLPEIVEQGARYRKSIQVQARPAVLGETIISVTDDGEETVNTAGDSDMVIKNLTAAQEQYLIGREKFEDRYSRVEAVDEDWTLYNSAGEILAVTIGREMTSRLGVGDEFYIMAAWGEQVAKSGDYFVAPWPEANEIYRIARSEFEQSYQLQRKQP